MDSDGNVWFCVSGYMNRGRHEGENGIAVYYYEDASATVEEILFVKTMESYDMLKLDIRIAGVYYGKCTGFICCCRG